MSMTTREQLEKAVADLEARADEIDAKGTYSADDQLVINQMAAAVTEKK